MEVQYKVHEVTQGAARVPVIVEGQASTAAVDCVTVEMTPLLPRHGSIMLRFIGDERAGAANLFTQDKVVTFTISEAKVQK